MCKRKVDTRCQKFCTRLSTFRLHLTTRLLKQAEIDTAKIPSGQQAATYGAGLGAAAGGVAGPLVPTGPAWGAAIGSVAGPLAALNDIYQANKQQKARANRLDSSFNALNNRKAIKKEVPGINEIRPETIMKDPFRGINVNGNRYFNR